MPMSRRNRHTAPTLTPCLEKKPGPWSHKYAWGRDNFWVTRAFSILSPKVLLLSHDCCLSVCLRTATISSPSTMIDLVQHSLAYGMCQPSLLWDRSFHGIGVRSLWSTRHQLLPCASWPQSLAALSLQNRPEFSPMIRQFSPPRRALVRSSLMATLSYCSSTSLSILAVRVLGLHFALLFTFLFYYWLVFGW